jgi:hypothetical protein
LDFCFDFDPWLAITGECRHHGRPVHHGQHPSQHDKTERTSGHGQKPQATILKPLADFTTILKVLADFKTFSQFKNHFKTFGRFKNCFKT